MTDLYLLDIPRPVTSAALDALREAMGLLAGNAGFAERGPAFALITEVTAGRAPIIGSTDADGLVEAAVAVLEAHRYVTSLVPPPEHSEAENGSESSYEESVALTALVIMRLSGGNATLAIQNVAMLANSTGEGPDAPDVFYDAGALIAQAFDMEAQLQHIDGIGKLAGLMAIR